MRPLPHAPRRRTPPPPSRPGIEKMLRNIRSSLESMTCYGFLERKKMFLCQIFNSVNTIFVPANQTPGIFIIPRIMKIPRVWSSRLKSLFTQSPDLRLVILGKDSDVFGENKGSSGFKNNTIDLFQSKQ